MISINLICVGNLKERFSKDEQAEYLKRLLSFCKLEITELKEQNHLENISLIVEKESEEILKKVKGYVVLCDVGGTSLSSDKFAQKLSSISMENSTITFVVGGSYGVSEKVRKEADFRLSFSQMTFPHNMFRIMLLEQIYRAYTILAGKSYHK